MNFTKTTEQASKYEHLEKMSVTDLLTNINNEDKTVPLAVEKALLKHIPKAYLLDAHHWLILLGRYICVARNPRCGECLIADLCDFKEKTA